jgi:hypothetical protein
MTNKNFLNDYIVSSTAVQSDLANDSKAYEAELHEIQARIDQAQEELKAKALERDIKLAEYNSSFEDLCKELAPRISSYNRVIELTLDKFRTQDAVGVKVRRELLIPYAAKLVRIRENKAEGVYYYTFQDVDNRLVTVSAKLLRNDPIAVAQKTRQSIRYYQRRFDMENLEHYKRQLHYEKHNIGVVQKRHDEAANNVDKTQKRLNNLDKKFFKKF